MEYANTILNESGKELLGLDGKVRPLKQTMPAQGGSTDVGDVKSIIQEIDNCFITSYNPIEIGKIIKLILASNLRSNGRRFMNSYRLDKVAKKIKKIYLNI